MTASSPLGLIIALFGAVAQAHDHDTSKIPEGQTVSLEPLVRSMHSPWQRFGLTDSRILCYGFTSSYKCWHMA